ncbi:MAG TPA: class II D-tagatose-bisphosphate aldolase, non-catalytic subunit [Anaerolineae bacterium]|nr:class II D-tagatose-bisphosphate aldolase, non-catalytic subunit [Anaerolineae bacterium]
MKSLDDVIRTIVRLREAGSAQITLLAVCPNSAAVLEAAVKVAALNHMPMLFAATLNQVDRDGGYTGWTPTQFVSEMRAFARKYDCTSPLYACLDHGGPWLKDRHTLDGLSYEATMLEVKRSLTACLEAGYQLLHIDPTVDRRLPPGRPVPVQDVVDRTIELIAHAEAERRRLGLPPVAFEVGTEEVHGGLVDFGAFESFIKSLHAGLEAQGLSHAWPCFVVAQVGTDLHTAFFDATTARRLTSIVAPMGTLLKGHYTDWVENPAEYAASGMGGANVGPEFTSEEYLALRDLEAKEQALCRNRRLGPSRFTRALEKAVVDSGRWKKWLQPEERGLDFDALSGERRSWLAQTGARYVWTHPDVVEARRRLYSNLEVVMPDPHAQVVERIARAIDKYVLAFNLFDSLTLLEAV